MEKALTVGIKEIHEKLDSMEELLRMSLATNIFNDIELAILKKEEDEGALDEDIATQLSLQGMCERKHYEVFGKMIVELESKEKVTVREMKSIYEWIIKEMKDVVPVFYFDELNGMKRKRMLEEKLSFIVKEREIHIVTKFNTSTNKNGALTFPYTNFFEN